MSVATQVPHTTPAMGLSAAVFDDGGVTVVAFRGEADAATVHVVVGVLSDVIADEEGDVVVDLAQMEFIDTAALRAVLRAREKLEDNGRHLTLRSPSRIAGRLLGVFGLGHLASGHIATDRGEPQ